MMMCKLLQALLNKPIATSAPIPISLESQEVITRAEYIRILKDEYDIRPIDIGTPLDRTISLPTKAELDRIAPELVYPADLYIAQIADCEDYGLQAQCDSAFIYHTNTVRLAIGMTPLGPHGWVLALDKSYKLWFMENNAGFEFTGKWFKPKEHGYIASKAFA